MPAATIVFCDIVKFSLLPAQAQETLITKLNAEVTHELYSFLNTREQPPQIICLATGDWLALALLHKERSSWGVTLFQLVARLMQWKERERVQIRIGVHVGAVSLVSGINRNANVCGGTINMCQRIMDAANPGQVLFSEEARREYVGGAYQFADPPFSASEPAQFSETHTVVVKHGVPLNVRVMHLGPENQAWNDSPPRGRQSEIIGKEERTEFIVERLERLQPVPGLRIYERSAFSTFGIPEDRDYKSLSGHSDRYFKLLMVQKKSLVDLALKRNNSLRIMLYAVHYASPRILAHRFRSVLSWMEQVRANANVEYVCDEYQGPNRLIVIDPRGRESFGVEGFKLHDTAGYEMSLVLDERERLEKAVREFDKVFERSKRAGRDKGHAEGVPTPPG